MAEVIALRHLTSWKRIEGKVESCLYAFSCEARPSPRVLSPTENTIGERFMVKEKSAAFASTRPWTQEGRGLTLSIASMI
ncbi:hypothetical protein AVEN_91834-1 [Araneus ventricosus]|uniref:Uncharacterized protein n=1 Tax=Araneus ventricosus TaxID=182803 RepID=A0A4Y2G3P2_ARAVE|nr:hypothetical protein AVEN_91834-1 [Araneus ventricosus]